MNSSLRNRSFLSLLGSNNFSALGDALYIITISWFISETYRSGSLMGSIMLVMGIAQFTLAVFGGGAADRFGPRKVMVLSDVLRAALMLALWAGLQTGQLPIWSLFVITTAFGIVDAFYWPALAALQQRVVSQGEYSRANGLSFTTIRLINILGPAAGGVLLATTSYSYTLLITVTTFLISALFLTWIPDPRPEKTESSDSKKPPFWGNVKQGFSFVLNSRILLLLLAAMFFCNIGANGIMSIRPFLAQELGFSADGFGFLYVSLAVGSFAMGLLLSVLVIRRITMERVLLAFFGQGLFTGIIWWLHDVYVIAAAFCLVGACTAVLGVMIPTIFQTTVPAQHMGQVGGILMTVSMASTPFSHFLFGILTDALNASAVYGIAGLIEVCAALGVLLYVRGAKVSFSIDSREHKEMTST